MQRQKGAITLEGAISTLVLMAIILTFSSFMKIVHVHGVIQHALIQTAGEMAQYSYLYSLAGLDDVNNALVAQGEAGSETVSKGIDEVETFLNQIGNGSLVQQPELENLNPKELAVGLCKALGGELVSEGKTRSINYMITKPLLESYLPIDKETFFAKNNVIQDGDFVGIDLSASRYFENADGYDEIELVAVYQMKVISPIPIFDEITIAQSAKSRAYFSGKADVSSDAGAEEPSESEEENKEESVWDKGFFDRANTIVKQEKIPANYPQNFQAIRGFDEKTATACTYATIDLNENSYQDSARAIRKSLKKKLNAIEKFEEDTYQDISLQASQIQKVDYYIVIPEDISSEKTLSIFEEEVRKLGDTLELSDGRKVKLNIIVKQVK